MEIKAQTRVITKYGPGTVLDYDMANDALPPKVRLVWTGRWCVKLDDSPSWFKNGIACFYPNELTLETQSAP